MSLLSLAYFLFLLLAWVASRLTRTPRLRQPALLLFSWVFYWAWSPGFLALLVLVSVVNYVWARLLRRRPGGALLAVAVGSNVLWLGLFKYLPALWGWASPWHALPQLIAPIGISFYTFQAISYLLDVYRGYEEEPTLLEVSLYLAFWPTILSGPICRLPEMLPQFRSLAQPDRQDLAEGFRRLVQGLFFKVVLAEILFQNLGGLASSAAWTDQKAGNAWDVWVLCLGYGFYIFFDFAGYTHIAIGSARLFGIRLRENFDAPFLAATISGFWTRWHMSLSSWIRDYLFFPLATRHSGLAWRHFALVASMFVFGLWHGPRLTFVLWGTYHGLLLAAHRQIQQWRRRRPALRLPGAVGVFLSWAVTFGAVTLGWLLFAPSSWKGSWSLIRLLGDFASPSQLGWSARILILAVSFLYLGAAGLARSSPEWLGRERAELLAWFARPIVLATMLIFVLVWGGPAPFVYVQF